MTRFSHLTAALACVMACKGSNAAENHQQTAQVIEVADAAVDPGPTTSGSGGAEHRDPTKAAEGGKAFNAYKESWVYVDGVPRGVLMFPEIPSWVPVAWADDVEGLDFNANTPPDQRNKKVQLMRYRVTDYLKAIGVDPDKVKAVYVHGNGCTVFTHDMLKQYGDGITFDFTGNDMTKTRFYWPADMKTNARYDRYAAVSVFVDKAPPTLDEHFNTFIDGQPVNGIPYHGTPERGGVRVYLDGKLAYVIKRNLLSTVGRIKKDEPRWSLQKLLEANGIKAEIGGIDVVSEKDPNNLHRDRIPDDQLADVSFETSAAVSGEVIFGKQKLEVNAFLLYSKGHVPASEPLPELERDWQPPKDKATENKTADSIIDKNKKK